jgi:16S rRNA (cytosine967-C5)-methyltransferase
MEIGGGAYAHVVLPKWLKQPGLGESDRRFITELVNGVCRERGVLDPIIAAAAGRPLETLQPAVIVILRMLARQVLRMRVPHHSAVHTSVELAGQRVGERTRGLVNAVGHQIAARDFDQWAGELTAGMDDFGKLAFTTFHPRWIVAAYSKLLPAGELEAALAQNNVPARTTLVLRPGLSDFIESGLLAAGTGFEAARYSPYGGYYDGNPGRLAAVADGGIGVQDEGSQLVALALSRVDARQGWWLDLCAGPGGKAALLTGLALQDGSKLLASEIHPHRAELVKQNLRGYRGTCVVADGRHGAWNTGSFTRVLADVPCTGLGALRRRADARWRKSEADLETLVPLQRALLAAAVESAAPGGVVAYVTCSPLGRETAEIVAAAEDGSFELLQAGDYLPEVPDAATGPFVQLWPHRHGTDAMFLALLRKRGNPR